LWESLVLSGIGKKPIYQNTLQNLSNQLTNGLSSEWKSTFKEEFVWWN
jgi:hypothetical protein